MPDPQLTVTSSEPPPGDALSVTKSEPLPDDSWVQFSKDVAAGVFKGVGNTVFGLGKVVHDYTPVGRLSDAIQPGAFDRKPPEIVPTNTAQKIGYTGEQIGEFFVPAGTATKAAKAVNVAKDAALALVQSGSPAQAGVTGALSAVIPGAGAARGAAGALESSAEKTMAQALGATKEWAKEEAAKLGPQMLARGVGGSRPAMLETAKATAKRVGQELTDAYTTAAAAGATVPSAIIRGHVDLAADALKVPNAAGVRVAIPGTESVIAKLDELGQFVDALGADIPVDRAAVIKKTWDQIVSKAGLYGPKATSSATDSASAWAIREAAGSFRALLNADPSIAALNAELGFWTGLRKVLTATEKRTQAQGGGLIAAGMGGSGAIVGALSGDSASDRATKAVIGGMAGRQFVKLIQSPAWRTQVTAPMKSLLADALASGATGQIQGAIARIAASLPAQLRPSLSDQLAQ